MPLVEIDTNDGVRLTHALLIYEEDGGGDVVITRHQIKNGVIQPGAPLDTASFCKLIESGKGKATAVPTWSMQFPRLLGESPEFVAWWSRPQLQRVFIGQDHRKAKAVEAWVPGLVWIASRSRPSCQLRAYDGLDAPTLQTDLYHPVFGNHIHGDGSICVGTAKLTDYSPASWERAFWSSCFTSSENLRLTPYACPKAFKKVGTLATVLPHRQAAH
jgi:PRTRC genetic system protein B